MKMENIYIGKIRDTIGRIKCDNCGKFFKSSKGILLRENKFRCVNCRRMDRIDSKIKKATKLKPKEYISTMRFINNQKPEVKAKQREYNKKYSKEHK